ncbi:MAG: methionyl-tRNA formyltransferase [Armatimonadetes bacterium]|nr:methionyl-tRNA formyltransferase [Armatimonadota bacterium]
MSVVFFGTASFAVPALRVVAKHCALVVTQPDRPSGRGMKLQASPAKEAAMELALPVATPEKARDPEFVASIAALNPDILVVAAYGQILSEALLNTGKHGGINLHGSILPKYRGAAPIQRAIMDGETKTGVTLMQMAKGMDTGDIIDIDETAIVPDETYGELQDRLAEIAARQLEEWLDRLVAGTYPRLEQDHSKATHAAKLTKQEGELQWDSPAAKEYNRFRAFTPSPGATLRTKLGLVRISKARLHTETGEPGTVLKLSAGCLVAFGDGSIELLEVQPEGRKRISGLDFANGYRLSPGSKLK